MKIQGYINKFGKVYIPHLPKLVRDEVEVWVEIPDSALDKTNTTNDAEQGSSGIALSERAKNMLDELESIRLQSLSEEKSYELTEKQRERMEAFELRSKLREEQGRPE